MKSLNIVVTVFAFTTLLALNARAADKADFIFGAGFVRSLSDPTVTFQIGDSYPVSILLGRGGSIKIRHSNECEGECYIASRGNSSIEIHGSSASGITSIISFGNGSIDVRGNAPGGQLSSALSAREAICSAGDFTSCSTGKIGGLSYIVRDDTACVLNIPPTDSIPTPIPECARIGGFLLRGVAAEPTTAKSDGDGEEALYNICGERWGTPGAIALCLEEEDKRAGAKLTKLYKAALMRMPYPDQTLVREAQRAWLKHQGAQCAIAQRLSEREGIAIGALAKARCILRSTLQRILELERLLED